MQVKHDPEMYINTFAANEGQQYYPPDHNYPPTSAGGSNGNSSGSTKQGPAEANFKCDFCPKSFTRKDHLVRHKANHSQQNHYCQTCGRAFKRLDLLQRHEKRQICTASDLPRPKRQRSSSASSNDGEEDYESQRPYSATSYSYSNPQPIAASLFGEIHPGSINMGNTMDPNSASSMSDQSNSQQLFDLTQPLTEDQITTGNEYRADTNDFGLGFGIWPPDSWEALFEGEVQPPWLDPTTLTVDIPYQSITPRIQESSERNQVSLANAALVVKIAADFPGLPLDLRFVSDALGMYWTHIAPTFPFIHRGTFEIDEAPCEMVLMMIIVGSMNMPVRRDFNFSQTVASIRGKMVQNCGLEMPITTLQCFTLCHVYDTWYGTSDSQFIAQCLWPVMVAHSRKKGIGVVGKTDDDAPQEEGWAVWAKDEERRRAVYCILLIDTQLSAFWNQHVSRQLSIFAHHAALPCPKAQWEAVNASDWFRARDAPKVPASSVTPYQKRKQQPGNLPGLHPEFQVSSISEGYATVVLETLAAENAKHHTLRPDLENCLAVEMALMGLMAIAWDCRTRGGMGIRFHAGVKHWRHIVMNAVIHLRARWEIHVGHVPGGIESRDMRDTFAISIVSVLSDIPMLQVAAGATQVCGSPIGARQYADAKRRLRLWAKTEDAWTCIWQSMRYLRQTLFTEWGIYTPWAVYLTTLVSWAYITATTQVYDHPITQDPHNSRRCCNALLDYVLASVGRVEPREGLGDLIATSAGLLDSEHAGGRLMQREMGALLWRLVMSSGKGEGKKRRQSIYSP